MTVSQHIDGSGAEKFWEAKVGYQKSNYFTFQLSRDCRGVHN